MNRHLLQPEVQQFITQHQHDNVQELLLKGIDLPNVSGAEVAEQIVGLNAFQDKAPAYVKEGILYPPKLNIEQTSSELTALYKRSQLPNNFNTIVDATGGLGIDLFYCSTNAKYSHYCELNKSLLQIAEHNFTTHGLDIQCHLGNGIEFLQSFPSEIDVLFLDPSRRHEAKGKIISLQDSEPNIFEHWQMLLAKAKLVMVKLSPMLDLQYLMNELPHLKELHVVSIKNDVKEVIAIAEEDFTGKCELVAAELFPEPQTFRQSETDEEIEYASATIPTTGFIYEPFGVLLKTQLQDAYAKQAQLKKIAPLSHLYLGGQELALPLMRTYQYTKVATFKPKQLKKELAGQPINVVCRNFKLAPKEVLIRLGVKQGGENTLICTTQNGEAICFFAKRLLNSTPKH